MTDMTFSAETFEAILDRLNAREALLAEFYVRAARLIDRKEYGSEMTQLVKWLMSEVEKTQQDPVGH